MRVVPRAVIVSASESGKARFGTDRRLHLPREFAAAMARKRVLRGERFDLHLGEKTESSCARLGLIVPKRLAHAASLRNAVKRQGREAFRQICHGLERDVVLRLKVKQRKQADGLQEQKRSWRGEIDALLRQAAEMSG